MPVVGGSFGVVTPQFVPLQVIVIASEIVEWTVNVYVVENVVGLNVA